MKKITEVYEATLYKPTRHGPGQVVARKVYAVSYEEDSGVDPDGWSDAQANVNLFLRKKLSEFQSAGLDLVLTKIEVEDLDAKPEPTPPRFTPPKMPKMPDVPFVTRSLSPKELGIETEAKAAWEAFVANNRAQEAYNSAAKTAAAKWAKEHFLRAAVVRKARPVEYMHQESVEVTATVDAKAMTAMAYRNLATEEEA